LPFLNQSLSEFDEYLTNSHIFNKLELVLERMFHCDELTFYSHTVAQAGSDLPIDRNATRVLLRWWVALLYLCDGT
jgi:hypothetical protein